jgi:hypothetical protein
VRAFWLLLNESGQQIDHHRVHLIDRTRRRARAGLETPDGAPLGRVQPKFRVGAAWSAALSKREPEPQVGSLDGLVFACVGTDANHLGHDARHFRRVWNCPLALAALGGEVSHQVLRFTPCCRRSREGSSTTWTGRWLACPD